MTAEKKLTTTLNDSQVTLEYQPDEHTLSVMTSRLSERPELLANQVEEELSEIGVYTRVDDVLSATDGTRRVSLKPAAGVNLYNDKKLSQRFITQTFDGSAITRKRGTYRYHTTVSKSLLDQLDWHDKERVGCYPYITDDGFVGLEFLKTAPPHGLSLQLGSTGSLPIPSAIGTAAELDGHQITWEVEGGRLYGETTREPPLVSASSSALQRLTRLAQSKQETQEHFTCYLRKKQAETLGWVDGDYVDIQMVNAGDGWGLLVTDSVRPHLDTSASCVRKIREYKNNQLNFYMPNRLVHGFALTEAALRWGVTADGLIGVPEKSN